MNDAALYYESESHRALHRCNRQESERRTEGSWKSSQAHHSQVPIRNSLLGKGRRTRVLAIMNLKRRPTYWVQPILKEAAENAATDERRVSGCGFPRVGSRAARG